MPVGTSSSRCAVTLQTGKTGEEETYSNFDLVDVLDVFEVDVALDAVATSVHWEGCGVASVEYDIEAASCACMT